MEKKTFWQRVKAAGPAAVITSAFIGPGTITTSTLSGVNFGYALLWSVLFSGISLVIIMNMASRLAIVGKRNIVDASLELFKSNAWKVFVTLLIATAIGLTALGFEAGNLIGATAGFSDIFGLNVWLAALIMGLVSLAAIVFSTPKIIELIMKMFVGVMGVIFVITAVVSKPDYLAILKGFIPSVPNGALVNTVALIGTTIIAINLVFHSIASADKWHEEKDLEDSYFDTKLNVSLGVVMTLALIITTSAVLFGSGTVVNSPIVYSKSLEPVLGSWARIFGSTGLIFAGLSSAIATPYMTGVIFGRVFKWNKQNDMRPKVVAAIAVLIGMGFAMFGAKPTSIIVFAQATSGVFLPFISILFVVAANKEYLGKFKNNLTQNLLSSLSVVVTFGLGMWTLYNALKALLKF